jgi:hypothetical protein
MIIAVDFDGTIQITEKGRKIPNLQLIQKLRNEQKHGAIIILWSCREKESLMEAVRYCIQYGLKPNYINANAPESIQMLGHDSRKIYADVYIDDKNAR